jgi:hypothetical protein
MLEEERPGDTLSLPDGKTRVEDNKEWRISFGGGL